MQSPADTSERLLQLLLEANFDLAALKPHLSAVQIADLALHPLFQARFDSLLRLAGATLLMRATLARTRSMTALDTAVTEAPNPIEKRRAATALLRASAAPLIPLPRERLSQSDEQLVHVHQAACPSTSSAPHAPLRTAPNARDSAAGAASSVRIAVDEEKSHICPHTRSNGVRSSLDVVPGCSTP